MSEIRKDPAFSGTGDSAEQIQGHGVQDWARFEQLHDQLADMLFPVDGGEIDEEALDALLEQMEAVNPPPASLTTDPEDALEEFYRRYAPVVEEAAAKETPASLKAPEKRRSTKPFAKAVPIAAALILLMGSVTAQAFGFDVFSAIARWTSEIFRLDGGSTSYATVRLHPLEEGEEATYDTLEEAVEAFGIDAPIVPKEIPEGFELTEVTATCIESGILIYANYENESRFFRIQYKEIFEEDTSAFEKEYKDVAAYIKGSIKHYFLVDLDRYKMVWQNGDFECKISGDLSEQEIKDVINSIYGE